jgi:hypothetical protein
MFFGLVLLVATAAAVRGLWSPCGLSMLSSLNPVAERARGHRFWLTALWYAAGAVVGGLLLGGACALGALAVAALGLPDAAIWGLAALSAALTLASDLRVGGWQLPIHPRQVDERWLTTYRRWIYAGGFGVQIGTGFATYVMTAATYLLAALAVVAADAVQALAAGAIFGLVRGLGIALGGIARDPDRLLALMARVDSAAGVSVVAACGAEALVAAAAVGALAGPVAGGAVGLALAGAIAATHRPRATWAV